MGSKGHKRETLSETLAQTRKGFGLTLRDLEETTGISNALISQIETGHIKEPSWRNVVKLARALAIPLDHLAECG